MAEEKKILTKEELRVKAEELCKSYNDANQSGDFATAAKCNDDIEQVVNEYTALIREETFKALSETEDPMLEAVKQLRFETIATKDNKKGEDKIPVREIVNREKAINLSKLDRYCGGIGKESDWYHKIQKLNKLLTAQKAKDLGVCAEKLKDIDDSYMMSDIAKKISFGQNPTSKTNLLKSLNAIISAMIGEEYKATSHDVNFLMSIYAKKSRKALTVSTANHNKLTEYMAEICHKIVLGMAYDVEYKAVK